MKVTCVPEQIVVAVDVIFTESVPVAFTVIVIAFEVEVAGDTQLPVGVMTQVTTFPFISADELYVLPVPTGVEPTSH